MAGDLPPCEERAYNGGYMHGYNQAIKSFEQALMSEEAIEAAEKVPSIDIMNNGKYGYNIDVRKIINAAIAKAKEMMK